MIKVLHNPQCSKSNCALDYLKTRQLAFEVRDYQNDPLDKAELKTLCEQLGLKPEDIVRKTEPVYKKQFAGKHYSDEEWFDILAGNPVLIQRPIIIHEGKAIIARPVENMDQLL
ncbi:MAG TPA: ArsC/Spx/MgsR family protein [Edaphocola sp.]|nr:ArsC/Spx/MgsR family protein [Edaphocola sp.]